MQVINKNKNKKVYKRKAPSNRITRGPQIQNVEQNCATKRSEYTYNLLTKGKYSK